ncbi:peptidyl-alpha-hydroxyglycine alpha-amidating lyase family protein [Paeniroseomonas aquatica]|uniref:peptidyl-alpha-hydroxyglycine alpha-amidating lyase family protein n=1 Tax=Paeniroseomonas aquatica TaxID=373043 RepID=UPI00360A0A77
MADALGSGDYRYEPVPGWGRLPEGWQLRDVGAVAVDSQDRVYVFNRGEYPMVVFDRDGKFLTSWGEGLFARAHGLHMGPDDTLWCTDDGDHTVRRCTLDGRVLMTLGVPGRPSPYMGGMPFNRCTHTALSPEGDIYVSDGYGNAQVHKYSSNGKYLFSWGGSGTEPGQFNLPHNIAYDADGWVYVADRESHRVQIFNGDGRYETQWNNLHRPCSIFLGKGRCPVCYVGELGPALAVNITAPILARASASSRMRASCCPASASSARARGSSSRRMGWRWTATATSMSAKSPIPPGRATTAAPRHPMASAACRNSDGSRHDAPPRPIGPDAPAARLPRRGNPGAAGRRARPGRAEWAAYRHRCPELPAARGAAVHRHHRRRRDRTPHRAADRLC